MMCSWNKLGEKKRKGNWLEKSKHYKQPQVNSELYEKMHTEIVGAIIAKNIDSSIFGESLE